MVKGCPQYRPEMQDFAPPNGTWVAICGSDVVRTHDGFQVLEDNLRVPSGVSYMIANRKAAKASLPRLYRANRVQEVEQYGAVLQTTLTELAPGGKFDPVIALLTPGVYNSAYYEHMFLAREIDAELVEGQDLVVRNGILYMRTTDGLQQVDVLFALSVPGTAQLGQTSRIANAPGTGVADDKSVYAYVPDMIRYLLGLEEPLC
ncbi:Uncharacterized protein sll0335 [Geodia barretti]|uniref:Uncharacterized protein sll0335 n=1 Tax=Geodia barretti TaxID=519541 RepID=A0AA35W7A6_GEOBA|nr:Uncharacterized protein sll0335 [Geodia barretti]